MKINDMAMQKDGSWEYLSQEMEDEKQAQLVFVFGDTEVIKKPQTFEILREKFPKARILGSSSSGNILGKEISSSALVATAVLFESSRVELYCADLKEETSLQELSADLASKLTKEGLKHVFVLSDGLRVNGSELVRGINDALYGVSVTGGLAGDGARFLETYVVCDAAAKESQVAVLGFYGENLRIGTGCFGGWSEFGVQRTITKSKGNILYEIDGEPALELYKRYLGEYASELPNSGLRFPLSIKKDAQDAEVIRTLLGVDEETKSIVFAGDVPEGYMARLMKPDMEKLIEGAGSAAREIEIANDRSALGLVVSCVGRKIVLGQVIDEELEEVADVLGESVHLVGFYSYGEIAPFAKDKLHCQLHNQTMTLSVIFENEAS